MKLENEFTVEAPVEEAWAFLLDLEKVTPCLPGAALGEASGDGYNGTMTVKIGPVSAKYDGTVHYEETDESNRRAVLKADGKDARGQGTASATITSTLHEENGGTRVSVETDMQLTGRIAQFGGNAHQEVASRIMTQFADCLSRRISGEEEPAAAGAGASAQTNGGASAGASAGTSNGEEQPKVRKIEQPAEPVEPLDLGSVGHEVMMERLKKAAPLLAGVGAVLILIWLLRRRSV